MEHLLSKIQEQITHEKLPLFGNRILCAISGGMDSVVMVHLLYELGIEMEFAHANFQLRGQESTRDEMFVRDLAKKMNVVCHVKHFETDSHAKEHHLSIQVAARSLRYSWFSELMDADPKLKFVCTAHHADDNIETLMMHFFKGTGMQGLKGIPVRQGNIIRPMLSVFKDEIRSYALFKSLTFVEDSSNLSDKYERNFFRNNVIPLIKEIYPEVVLNLRNNLIRFNEAEILYSEAVKRKTHKLLVFEKDGTVKIPIEKLRRISPLQTMLYEIFSQWGFSPSQLNEINRLMDSQTGKLMYSKSHQLLKNRNWFIVTALESRTSSVISIGSISQLVQFELGSIEFKMISHIKDLDTGVNRLTVDADEVSFPIILRRWKAGDYFYPLGMKKKKKISRFLIDQKISLIDKEKIWVLESKKRVICVVGHRLDDRFKITSKSKHFMQIVFSV